MYCAGPNQGFQTIKSMRGVVGLAERMMDMHHTKFVHPSLILEIMPMHFWWTRGYFYLFYFLRYLNKLHKLLQISKLKKMDLKLHKYFDFVHNVRLRIGGLLQTGLTSLSSPLNQPLCFYYKHSCQILIPFIISSTFF